MEGMRLQVGEFTRPVKIVVSTLAELEFLRPALDAIKGTNRSINVLYGIPLPASQVERLAMLGRGMGRDSISVLIDHPDQIAYLSRFTAIAGFPPSVFLKVDTGYHRAGLPPHGLDKNGLITSLMQLEKNGEACFLGLYSHSSLSYNDSTPEDAMAHLESEIQGCLAALEHSADLISRADPICLSVGASPQVTAIEHFSRNDKFSASLESLRKTIQSVTNGKTSGVRTELELHAGVYSLLDVQQMSTKARSWLGAFEDEIGVSVVTEVVSVYNDHEREKPEALLAAGCLALGREPCAAYKGWGVVHRGSYSLDVTPTSRLIVARVSQEHSIVSWEDNNEKPIPLTVGQTIRVFPNHACITGAMYPWYLVVDSDSTDHTSIVDVWIRASGW